MKLSLPHFLTTDNLRLPGLLYEPEKRTNSVAIFLHGNGSSSVFYKPEMNLWGKELTEKGIAFFPFNNRGAHFIKSLKQESEDDEERVLGGTYFEMIKDCVQDIDGAIQYLQKLGYETFYLIGHSTGANKIVVYDFYQKNNHVTKYILLAGGDDTGLNYEMLGKERFHQALERAKQEIEKGNGLGQVPQSVFPEPFSWQSLYDILNPDGDYNIFPFNEYMHGIKLSTKPLFHQFAQINKPTLVVYGDQDEYCYENANGCRDALKKHNNSSLVTYKLVTQANHGFDGKEKELGEMMVDWIQNVT